MGKNCTSQGGRSWKPFSERKNGHNNFCQARIFAIFTTNAPFLRVFAILQILFSITCNYRSAPLTQDPLFLTKKSTSFPPKAHRLQ